MNILVDSRQFTCSKFLDWQKGYESYEHLYLPRMVATKSAIQINKQQTTHTHTLNSYSKLRKWQKVSSELSHLEEVEEKGVLQSKL